jgi:hypothetical protein
MDFAAVEMAKLFVFVQKEILPELVPITTKVMSSNPAAGEMYLLHHDNISLSVAYDRSVAFFNCQCMLDASTD